MSKLLLPPLVNFLTFCRRLFGLAPATSFNIDCYD
jgi:hypothetical protein